MNKYREFWIAETLMGNLHIFRENHEGGGLTKFVENCYVFQLEQKVAENESLLSAKNAEIRKLERQLEVCKGQRNKQLFENYKHTMGYVPQNNCVVDLDQELEKVEVK
jgi:hypothetical protein